MNDLTLEFLDSEESTRDLYQKYDVEEDTNRISFHYDNDPEFFKIVTADDWSTYSAPLWLNEEDSLTKAQEEKFDLYAKQMQLQPGQRVLDVGCGWGGPLVYLCKKYGVKGHGITVSPKGLAVARQRAKDHGVDATFELVHFQNLNPDYKFDALYSDEVLVHIPDLNVFFEKAHSLLKPGGRMVHKELHFTHSTHKHAKDPLSSHVNKIFAFSGHYRTLTDVLIALDETQFRLDQIVQIPTEHYQRTIGGEWVKAIDNNRQHLSELTNPRFVKDFKLYLRGILHIFRQNVFNIHVVSAQKMD